MSLDKFGRFYTSNQSYENFIKRSNAAKVFGIIVDSDNNINVQNKRIKNISSPLEEKDAVSKAFLLTQINQIKADILINTTRDNEIAYEKILNTSQSYHSYIEGELTSIQKKLADLENSLLKVTGKGDVEDEPTIKYSTADEKYDNLDILEYTIHDEHKENSSPRVA